MAFPSPTQDTVNYEELRYRHLSDFLAAVPESIRHVKWPMERIKAERQQRLRSLIRTAKERSEWHRKRLENVDADSITEADLAKIPIMTKADLIANFDKIVTDQRLTLKKVNEHASSLREDRYLLDNYHVIASGGSSGFRGVFVYNWSEWITCALSYRPIFLSMNPLVWRLLAFRPVGKMAVNSRIRKKVKNQQSEGGVVAVVADIASHISNAIGNSLYYPFGRQFPATLPIQEIVASLNSAQPDSLVTYPSILYQLALEAKAGSLYIKPKRIASASEPLLPHIRKAVRDAWGIPVANIWGTSEGNVVAWGCGESEGMHLNEDLHILEPVDEDGKSVPPGVTASKIYFTNLFNHTLPLVRYEISDRVRFLDSGPCPCGSTFRRVDDIQGRLEDSFIYEEGITVHPIVFESALQHHPNVTEYQAIQTRNGVSISLLTSGPVVIGQLETDLREYLEKSGLHNPQVSTTIVHRLDRIPGVGKLKRFVPLITAEKLGSSSRPEVVASSYL